MAKKNFTSGLDSILSPTTKSSTDNAKQSVTPVSKSVLPVASGKEAKILIRLPADIKMKLDLYCIHNRTTKQEFVANLIINNL